MERDVRDTVDEQLLENWQRGMPIVRQPFAEMSKALGIDEPALLERLKRLQALGIIARVGGVVRPNTLGASTLAAVAAPDLEVDDVAGIIAAEPGINHVYLRENDWNLWFVATGPNRDDVDATLQRISEKTGRHVLDLRLEKPYHIDLGFALTGAESRQHELQSAEGLQKYEPQPGDRELAQCLTNGLPLVTRPFQAIAAQVDRPEEEVIARINELCDVSVFPRIGVIVRHRALGWRSNAMVVWDIPANDVDRAGAALAAAPGVNLCYRRTRHPREWPFNLYCMIHAKTRDEALQLLQHASESAGLEHTPRLILFSLRCFKQTGALVAPDKEAA